MFSKLQSSTYNQNHCAEENPLYNVTIPGMLKECDDAKEAETKGKMLILQRLNENLNQRQKYSLNSTLLEFLKSEEVPVNAETLAKQPLPRPSWINTAPGNRVQRSKTFFSPQLKTKSSLKVAVAPTPMLPKIEEKDEAKPLQKKVTKKARLLDESTVSLYCDAQNDY